MRKQFFLVLLFAATAMPCAAAGAATFNVTTTGDPASPVCPSASNCSFRGAVGTASGGDVIRLPAGTFELTQGEVVATSALTIKGAGRSATILDASGLAPSPSSRVLRITGAASRFTTVADLSVTGGRVVDGLRSGGGGIRCNSRAGLVLENVRVFGNSVSSQSIPADAAWIGGGGLWSIGTAILKRNSLVEQNEVTVDSSVGQSGGGGVMVAGDYPGPNLIVSASTIRNNTADVTSKEALGYQSDDGGGGAYVAANDLVLRSATVRGNSVTVANSWGDSGGGGLYVSGGSLSADNSTIDGNSANVTATSDPGFNPFSASSDGGGGAYVSGLSASLTGSRVTNNEVEALNSWGESGGGGLYVSSRDDETGLYVGDVNATQTLFRGNSVLADPTVSESRWASHYGGGAIYQDSHDVSISASTLSDNSVEVLGESLPDEKYSVNGGGAIYQYGNRLAIARSTLAGNTAELPLATRSGGGALMDNGNSSFVTNSTFSGNGIVFDQAAPAPDTNGGGAIIFVQVRDAAILANATIAGNRSEGGGGGAILPYDTDLRIGNSILASNSSTIPGTSECSLDDGILTWGLVNSLGYNLTNDSSDSCDLGATGDRVGAPRLATLASNGGPTQTRAIGRKSPAFNRGNPSGCESAYGSSLTADQRGFRRPSPAGGRCDIGAFEVQLKNR